MNIVPIFRDRVVYSYILTAKAEQYGKVYPFL